MYDLMLYRLPFIMVIATAGRKPVQKCHPQRQPHETVLQLLCRHNNYYLDFRSCYVAGFVEKITMVAYNFFCFYVDLQCMT